MTTRLIRCDRCVNTGIGAPRPPRTRELDSGQAGMRGRHGLRRGCPAPVGNGAPTHHDLWSCIRVRSAERTSARRTCSRR
jgi:hypothetical protein